MAGSDFGFLKVPELSPGVRSALKLIGPAAFALLILAFLPLWKLSAAGASAVPLFSVREVRGGFRLTISSPGAVSEGIAALQKRWTAAEDAPSEVFRDATLVAAELAINAFEHGSATQVEVARYPYCLVVEDDGKTFDPLKPLSTPRPGGGAGLYALNHVRSRVERFGVVYLSFNTLIGRPATVNNQIVINIIPSSVLAHPGSTFIIRPRTPIALSTLSRWDAPHSLEIHWGYMNYALQLVPQKGDQYPLRIISSEAALVVTLMQLLPPTGTLHLQTGGGDLIDSYYRHHFSKYYADRLIIE